MAKQRAEIACQYGFEDIAYRLFNRTRTFSAKEYTALLGTYSDHIALEKGKRMEFFSKIERAIDNCGGEITLFDTIDLQLARKPERFILPREACPKSQARSGFEPGTEMR